MKMVFKSTLTTGISLLSLLSPAQNRFAGDTAALDAYIKNCMVVYHLPGVVTAFVHQDELIWVKAYGYRDIERQLPMTDSTLFWLASVSKTITSTALMQMQENGLLYLDENINNYLPFQVVNPHYPSPPVTARRLITHTSSIADDWSLLSLLTTFGYDSPIPLGDFMFDYFDPSGQYYSPNHFYQYPAGWTFNYSNVGLGLAGYLAEAIMGTDFRTWCHDSVFTLLGMNAASWTLAGTDTSQKAYGYSYSGGQYTRYNHTGRPDYPAGWLNMNINELSLFLRNFINYGKSGNTSILDSATVESMLTVQYPSIPAWYGRRWGLGWYEYLIAGRTLWGHWGHGWGHTHDMYFDRESGIGVIVLSNGDSEAGVDSIMLKLFEFAEGGITSSPVQRGPEKDLLSVFPNPGKNIIRFSFLNGDNRASKLTITTLQGTVVKTIWFDGIGMVWNGSDEDNRRVSPGVYLVYISDEQGRHRQVKKLIIQP
jgi:CubicO group peptidase (beta-lactamase class C family)